LITDSYDPVTRPVVSPGDFYPEGDVSRVCLIIFSEQLFRYMQEHFSCEPVGMIGACNGRKHIWKTEYEGETIIFYLSAIGSCGAGNDLIETAHQTGARKFVMFGSAGNLAPEKTEGKYVLPTAAYRDEGLSYHYAPPSDYIETPGHRFLEKRFDEWKVPYVSGRIWTTDAIYRETAGHLKARQADGCLAVDMEVSGVQAVCDFHGFELYDFLQVGDVLREEDHDVSALHGANHDLPKLHLALRIAKVLLDET